MDAAADDAEQPDALQLVGIQAARDAADGTADVDIENAYVTYVKPAIGSEVAGFFIQDAQTGPALFIAVDPSTLSPVPVAEDQVSFTITEMGTASGIRQAVAISDFAVVSSDNNLSGLVQNVTEATDLVSALDSYESEFIAGTFTVTGDFTGAGTDHSAAVVESTGVTGDTDLRLRLPNALQNVVGFEPTCVVTVSGTPMWRFYDTAQVSAWQQNELAATCPAPVVVSATATSETTVEVTFSRGIDDTTITDAATQFTITGGAGLTVSAASVAGPVVTLTTSSQVTGESYTVTVASSVRDVFWVALGAPNSADFYGFGPESACSDGLDNEHDGYVDCQDADCSADAQCAFLAQLYLWELDSDTADTDVLEFIEVRNLSGDTIDLGDYYVLFVNGNGDTTYETVALTGSLAAGAISVVGNAGVTGVDTTFADNLLQNGADGVLLVYCPDCADADSIPDGTSPGTGTTFTVSSGTITVTKIDAIAYDTNDTDDAGLMAALGVATQWNEGANSASAVESLHRTSLAGWSLAAPSPDASDVEP